MISHLIEHITSYTATTQPQNTSAATAAAPATVATAQAMIATAQSTIATAAATHITG